MEATRLYSNLDLGVIFFYYLGLPVVVVLFNGLTSGSALLLIAFYMAKRSLASILNLVPLTTQDEMFLLDSKKNRANILTVMKITKVKDP